MNRAELTVVAGPQDAAARSRIAATRARDDSTTAAYEIVAEILALSRRLDDVAGLEMIPPGVGDIYSRLAAVTRVQAVAASAILERTRGPQS